MVELPRKIFSASQVRGLDRTAIQVYGIPSYELMCRAGQAALDVVRRRWPVAEQLTIFCGAGNNAGDGYVLARLALSAGYQVQLLAVVPGDRLSGDALRAHQDFVAAGGRAAGFESGLAPGGDLLVDALLGTGLDRALDGAFAEAVAAINAAGCPVLALDIPSGLHADTGLPLGTAVQASATLSFVGLKLGLFLGEAVDYCGELELADLGVPAQAYAEVAAPLHRLQRACLAEALPRRRRTAHKGSHGALLLVGGSPGMSGAIRLAAEAALRTGAGLVRVATHPDSIGSVGAGRPEIMCHVVAAGAELEPLITRSNAIVVGPGLGRGDWARSLWEAALASELPLVVDADGLNLLAAAPRRRDGWILTPHPGEAGRLLDITAGEVQADRLGAVRELASRCGGTVVLKGAGTLVAGPDAGAVSVCDLGNPGMGTAGMGDLLSGIIGAIVGQAADNRLAAEAGVYLHAAAGDEAAGAGERGLLAGDLMPLIRKWANPA